jgi:N-carbamoylputrescine amidase
MKPRVVRVAAIQMVSENGAVEANLHRATRMVEEAVCAGAQLIVLPELFSGGYWLCEKAWETAEPAGGKTERWLRDTAARLGVYLGGSYLLASGEDFLNMFALASPDGVIAGRVPKQIPASFEAYLFLGQESSHIIDTELGRIGVGICYDNAFRFMAEALVAGDADILLSPYCAPTPQQTWFYPRGRVEAFLASYRHGAQKYARLLGIPAVQVNKSGPWKSECPSFFPEQDSRFDGQSEIADSNGETLVELADQEAILVEDVTMDPARKVRKLPQEASVYGRWNGPVPWDFKMFWIVEALGHLSYRRNPRRREMAKVMGGLREAHLEGAADHRS